MSTTPTSAAKLAAAHAATLAEWEKQLAAMDAELQELVDYEQAVRMEYQAENPSKRSDGIDTPVTKLRRKVDELAGKRDRLAKDVAAKRQLLEGLTEQADAERQEQELREAEAAIAATEGYLAEKWAGFVAACEQVRALWPGVVEMASELDALPAGATPIAPFPTDLGKAFQVALTEPGSQPFYSDPRLVARRLSTAGGSAATDTSGFAHTLRQLGDWQ